MSFLNIKPNAATLVDSSQMSPAQVQRLGHADDVDSKSRLARVNIQRGGVGPEIAAMIQALEQAAARFAVRRDNFALGKSDTCLDIASKLQRFGSFASDRQADFAAKLVEWSKPRAQEAAQEPARAPIPVPVAPVVVQNPPVPVARLFALMQRLAKLEIGFLKLARKNGDSLVWIKHAERQGVVGKIEHGHAVLFLGRIGNDMVAEEIRAALVQIELDPEAAAVLHGKASGRCSVCSRDLTDPASIERGIGPICAEKFQF